MDFSSVPSSFGEKQRLMMHLGLILADQTGRSSSLFVSSIHVNPVGFINQIMKLTISVDFSQYHVIKTQTDTHKKKVSELNSIKKLIFS